MIIEEDELLKDFVIESQEHLSHVESQLLELESTTGGVDVAKVNQVFRAIHSIKGVAGFLNLKTLESLAHREEEVLNLLRNNEVRPTRQVIKTLLQASDCIKELIENVTASNDQDVSQHIAALEQLLLDPDNLVGGVPVVLSHGAEAQDTVSPEAEVAAASISKASEPAKPNADVFRDFLIESHDNLEQLETALVKLEQTPQDAELLNAVFRSIHTIKGSSGFLGFRTLEVVTHSAENLLSDLRAGKLQLDARTSRTLFSVIDFVRRQLASIEKTQCEETLNAVEIVKQIDEIQAARPQTFDSQAMAPVVSVASIQAVQPPRVPVQPTPSVAPTENRVNSPVKSAATPNADVGSSASSAAESTIRVDVALLDKLMTRVGELVLARNQILQFSSTLGDSDLQSASQHLNLITTELQEGVMKTRMQPIGNVWGKFPRLVRDLAEICGKSVRIEMEGKETELDKTIIEAIKDPLTHLVRNTVDHGIEPSDVRVANGKPAEGCLYLRAYHEGGQVNIEISDDGGGLNIDRIKSKAVEKGLVTAEHASRLNDREAAQLIFLPGFSTAEKVSNVSGRGVGMDVVKTNIEKIGGTVDLSTTPGHGTSVKIKIPLTLAIIPALIITSNGRRFAIPQVNLLELVRIESHDTDPGIEWIQGAPVYRLRGRLLPLVYLRQVLKTETNDSNVSECINIVVLRVDDRQFGLVVDRINDTEEIVVKPMGKQFKGVTVFAGATIMGDGKVALILDVLGLAHSANVLSKDRNRSMLDGNGRAKDENELTQTLLVLGTGSDRRLALPISQVARLEKIPTDTVEHTDHLEVVQYRGQILPLVRLAKVLGIEGSHEPEDGMLHVVVYTEDECSYGLVVDRIIDIVQTTLETSRPTKRDGLLGSAIIQDHVTILVDLPAIIKQLDIMPGKTSTI
jgi:two-component system chemotaxis sensor kinase CheA